MPYGRDFRPAFRGSVVWSLGDGFAVVDASIDTSARTAVGLRVKVAVTLIAQQKYVCVHIDHTIADIVAGHDGNIEDLLALSIARDLLGGSAVA